LAAGRGTTTAKGDTQNWGKRSIGARKEIIPGEGAIQFWRGLGKGRVLYFRSVRRRSLQLKRQRREHYYPLKRGLRLEMVKGIVRRGRGTRLGRNNMSS